MLLKWFPWLLIIVRINFLITGNLQLIDMTQVFEEKLVCCPCLAPLNKCWTGMLRKMGYRGNEHY